MAHHNQPVEEFLDDAYWRAFDAGHYRVADKLKESLALHDQSDEIAEIVDERDGAQGTISDLRDILTDIKRVANADPQEYHYACSLLDEIAKLADGALDLCKL